MKNSFDEKILEEANDWIATKRNVILEFGLKSN